MQIKITVNRSTYIEFAHALTHYSNTIYNTLSAKDYIHFYNLHAMIGRSAIKLSHPLFKTHKKIIISLDVNEFQTLRFLFTKNNTGYTINRIIKNLLSELTLANKEIFLTQLDLHKQRQN